MDTGRLPEEVRENPSPRAMTQPFALGEGPGGEQSLATDTSMDYTAGFLNMGLEKEANLVTPTASFPTFIHTSETRPPPQNPNFFDHQMQPEDFWDPSGDCTSAVTPPFTGGDGMGGPYTYRGSGAGSDTGDQMEMLRDDQDHLDQSPHRSLSHSSWSQQGYTSPTDVQPTGQMLNWNPTTTHSSTAMQRTASTPQLGFVNDQGVKPLSLRTSSSTPKLLLTSKPSASWDLGKRSSSVGQVDAPWGNLPGHVHHASLSDLGRARAPGTPLRSVNQSAAYSFPQTMNAQPPGYVTNLFRFTAPNSAPQSTSRPQTENGYMPIPGPGLHQTLFNQGRRDSQPRLSLNIPTVGNSGARSAGPILDHPTPVTAGTNYGMMGGTNGNVGPMSAYPMIGEQAAIPPYNSNIPESYQSIGQNYYGQGQFYTPDSSIWMEPQTAETMSASASTSQDLNSAFPITPAGTLSNALIGLDVRSRSSSVSAGGTFEKRHAQKPYARQPSNKFVTTQPINSTDPPILADSQVFKFGPGLVEEQRESTKGRLRGGSKKNTPAKRKKTGEERDVDMDESCGDISTSVLDSDFDVDFPTHTAQGTLLTLEEREAICHQKLVGLAEEVKSATNSKAAELAKIKWTRAWLRVNYMPSADCTVAKQGAYEGYETSCRSYGFLPARKALLSSLLLRVFPRSNLRRLGCRRMSRYHYCGIQPVTGSQCQALNQFSEEQGNANGLIYQMPQATKSNNPLLEMGQRPGSGMFDTQQTEKTSRNQMADMSEGDLANMAATNRVEALDGYPTLEDFFAHMPAETAATLWENVRMHFNTLLEAFESWDMSKVQHMILLFWGSLADSLKQEIRKKTVGDLVNRCETLFWEEILRYLISSVAGPLSEQVIQQVNELGAGLENLMDISTKGFSRPTFDNFVARRDKMAKTIGHLLVRFCDLRRTSDVLKDLLKRQNLFISVLSAWKSLQWSSILCQTSLMLKLDDSVIRESVLSPFEDILQQACDNQDQPQIDEISIEEMSNWLQDLICELLQEGFHGKPVAANKIVFATTWFTSEIARDLTIKSSDCFGIYQLLKVWVDDFVSLFVQRKICLRD